MGRPYKLGRPITREEKTARQKEWRDRNKDRLNRERRERYAADADWRAYKASEAKKRPPGSWRDSHYKRTFGITAAEYDRMLAEQHGGCAICGSSVADATGRKLAVDHCHDSGRVRGLLCYSCNLAIAKLKDDPDLAERAAQYLRAGLNLV